jgi:type I restriction enzyme M protein
MKANLYDRLLSLTEVAELAEVGTPAVSNWRKRHPDFPAARLSSGQEIFVAGEIAHWLSERKIARNSLNHGEMPGTTYGDRFLHNLGISDLTPQTFAEADISSKVVASGDHLWRAMGLLRSHYDTPLSIVLVLSMLDLRARAPELWTRLIRNPHGRATEKIIAQAEESSPIGALHSSPFKMIDQAVGDRSFVELAYIIDEIDLGDSRNATSIAAAISENLLSRFERNAGRQGAFLTPGSLARCMVTLVDPNPDDRVYDPFCRAGELLATAAAHVEDGGRVLAHQVFAGQALSERSWQTTKLNLALHGINADLSAYPSHALRDDAFPGRKFDVVLANPPFNEKAWAAHENPNGQNWPFGIPPVGSANFAWLQHVASKLAPNGRAAVLMTNSAVMTRDGAEAIIRARMVDAGIIDCVVALPGQLFRSTGIPVSLWLLRAASDEIASEILFIDAKDIGAMADRAQRVLSDEDIENIYGEYKSWRNRQYISSYEARAGFAKSVPLGEIRRNDYVLNPRVYVQATVPETPQVPYSIQINELRADLARLRARSQEIRAILDAQLARINVEQRPNADSDGRVSVPLGEVCEVLTGPGAIERSESQASLTPVVLPRNIKQSRVVDENLDRVDPLTTSKFERYRLIPGDVVCTRIGTLGRYGLVQIGQAGWLLGPGCMRIRPTVQVDAEYLTYYLGSPFAYSWIIDHATGSAIKHINARTLSEIPLVLPSLGTQRSLATVLGALDTEISINDHISAVTQELQDLLLPLLISGP